MIGAHSKTGISNLLLGNVANAVVRNARSSVIVVRTDHKDSFVIPRRFLLCLDSSALTQTLLKSLNSRLWAPDSELKILHVLEPDILSESEDAWHDAQLSEARSRKTRAEMTQLIDTYMASTMQAFPKLSVERVMLEDIGPVEGILETAKVWKADSIIMGSHARTGIERILLGSVSAEVLAQAKCTLEILR